MKSTIVKYEPRIETKVDNTLGILKYDIDNAYPQRVRLHIENSGIASACVSLYAKFMRGQGFQEPQFYSAICNRKRWTFDKLLKHLTLDFAMFGGFAIHFNYNAMLEVSEMNYVPFEHVRISEPDDTDYYGKVKIYNDWGKKRERIIDDKKVKTLHIYDPSPDVVLSQIEQAMGIENYNGQVLYFTNDSENYPKAWIDPIIEDVETDGELKYFSNRNVVTGFMPQVVWATRGKFEDERDREQHLENIKAFQGTRNSSKVFHLEIESEEEMPKFEKFDPNIDDKIFEYTEKSVRERIITNFMIPNILLGISTPNALGEKNDREGAKNVYSDITKDERIMFEALFSVLFEKWHRKEDNPSNNFSIIPIQGVSQTVNVELYKDMTLNERRTLLLNLEPQQEQQAASKLLVEVLGVGGTQALQLLLTDLTLSDEQKRAALRLVFGFTNEDALSLIPMKDAQ